MELDGRWERGNRNPLTAAVLLVIGAGTFYFLVQSLLLNGYILVNELLGRNAVTGGDYRTILRGTYRRYQVPILSILSATQYLLLLLVTLVSVRRWHTRDVLQYLGYRRFPVAGVLLGIGGVLTLLPAVEYVGRFVYSLVPGLEKLSDATLPLVQAGSPARALLVYFAIAVTPAVCEETLFRGYFQRTLQRRMRAPWHYLLSGTIFALYHQQVLSLPSLILVGVYLGFLYSRYQSIYTTMGAHFAYNGTLILLANLPAAALPASGTIFIDEKGFTLPAAGISLALFAVVIVAIAASTRGLGSVRNRVDGNDASTR
ncbi:CPBP family glutamic-type intramembrane protease [Salinispira pacifica]